MSVMGKLGDQEKVEAWSGLDLGEGGQESNSGFWEEGGLPWCPVTKTLHPQCRGPGLDPWSGN